MADVEIATQPEAAAAAPPVAPAPSPTAAAADWRATLPDDLKAEKGWDRFKDVPALARSYRELEKKVGAKTDGMVRVPGPDATPEERAAWNAATGVPEVPQKYDLKPPDLDGTPITFDDKRINYWRNVFHEAGVPQEAAQKLINAYAAESKSFIDTQGQMWAEELRGLQAEWGGPRFTRSAAYAKRAVDMFFDDATKTWFDETRIGDHPGLFKGLAKIGEQFAEDGVIAGDVDGVPTPDQAAQQIADIQKRKVEAMRSGNERELGRLVEEELKLRRLMPGATKPVLTVG